MGHTLASAGAATCTGEKVGASSQMKEELCFSEDLIFVITFEWLKGLESSDAFADEARGSIIGCASSIRSKAASKV
jgi:hypothetical protein